MYLGEQIELNGFEEREPGELLIAKKLIGNHAKALMQRMPGFERLILTVERTPARCTVSGSVRVAGKTHDAAVHDQNVFFALDRCLKALGRA